MLQQIKSKNKITALYVRWSRDDGMEEDSSSIDSQKTMLSKFARENGFYNVIIYSDDGLTGSNFDREKFNEMISEIEKGKIDTIIIKDFSRLGRNYVDAGYYTDNYFPDKNIRVISLEDNYDSANGYNDIIPFKHIMNEFYIKDISKKVRFGFRAKALKGEYTGSYAPYGYEKDSNNKHKLIIDKEIEPIIKFIFDLATKNYTLYKISKILEEKKIPRPRMKQAQLGQYNMPSILKYPYQWQPATVAKIIKNRVYIGDLVSGQHASKSYKNKKLVTVSKEKWIIVENTHEAIIDKNTFELAQKIVKIKGDGNPFKDRINSHNIFRGLIRCDKCNSTLTLYLQRKVYEYACSTYRVYGKSRCSMHFLRYDAVYKIVLKEIQNLMKLVNSDKNKMLEDICESKYSLTIKEKSQKEKLFTKMERRIQELDFLIQKVFEGQVLGNISEERASILIRTYEEENSNLKSEVLKIQTEILSTNETKQNAEQFIESIQRYTEIKELTQELVSELIDKIIVHEGEYEGSIRKQQIDIYFRFVGII